MPVLGKNARHVRRVRRRVGAALLGLALTAPLAVALPAGAAAAARPAESTRPDGGEESRALSRAAEEGEPVEVLARRTENSQLFANPDGSFTHHAYALPQWVRQNDKLVDLNTTLDANSDGTFSPTAAEIDVTFSGGGDDPLATVTRDGRSMSVSWPEPLPQPVTAGDTITYPNVLQDVDLKLRANPAGYSQLLVVKSAQAAANPRLQEIAFEIDTQGVNVQTDPHGNLRALNPAGQEVFTAPTPIMWDSGDAQPSSPPKTGQQAAQSSDTATADAAKEAAVDVRVSDGQLTLTPDPEVLAGDDTEYPVYIDPSVEGSRAAWTIAYKKYPNSSYYNGNNWRNLDGSYGTTTARAGFENVTDGLARSYFRMRTKNLWSTDKIVTKSVFRIKNIWSWSCNSRRVELWRTAPMNSSTTWNNQPTKRQTLDTVNDAKGWSSSCPAGNLAFNTTAAAKDAAANHWNTITLALKATNESDVYGWKKFDAKSAVLSTTYNTRPDVPSNLDTSPVSTRNNDGCGDTAPYGSIGNTDFYLNAKVRDPDGGTVKATFHLWPTGHRFEADGGLVINKTASVTSGTVARVKVSKAELEPFMDVANGNFSWKAKADDGDAESDWNPTKGAPGCRFVFDPERPSTPPGVSSPDFPDGSEGWPADTGEVRTAGTFTFSASGVNDVVSYEYWMDSKPNHATVPAPEPGADVTIEFTPHLAGPQNLYVQSIDKAGNPSDTRTYLFYANGLTEPDGPGDINGDGNADLWGIDATGTLHRWYGNGDGSVTNSGSASATTWNDTKTTHRGDWTDDGYEDLIALRPDGDTHRLWIHPNNGYGFACTSCRTGDYQRHELTVADEANNHWKDGARQILAIGDMDGPLDTDGDGQPDTPGAPDLLVNDGDFLWLYYGDPWANRLDTFRDPVLIGDTGLSAVTLGAPGDFNTDGRPDMLVREEPTGGILWVYHGGAPDGTGIGNPEQRTKVGWNWGTDTVPYFTAAPDANNNGQFDIWATTPNSGRLRFFADQTENGHTEVTIASEAFEGYQSLS